MTMAESAMFSSAVKMQHLSATAYQRDHLGQGKKQHYLIFMAKQLHQLPKHRTSAVTAASSSIAIVRRQKIRSETPLQDLAPDKLKRLMLQAKLCSGKVKITKDDIKLLKEIVGTNKTQVRELQRFYERILSHLPAARQRYAGSPLEKFFLTFATG